MRVTAVPKVGKTTSVFCDSVAILECGKRMICYNTREGLNSAFTLEFYENITIDDSNVKWYDMLNWNELKETYDTLPQHIKDDLIKSGKAPKEEKQVDDACPCDLSSPKKCADCLVSPSSYFDSINDNVRIKNDRNLYYCPKCLSIAVSSGQSFIGLEEVSSPFHCNSCGFNWTIESNELKTGFYNKGRMFWRINID